MCRAGRFKERPSDPECLEWAAAQLRSTSPLVM
jgi:hypothetical protein